MLPAAHNLAVIENRTGRYEEARQRVEALRVALLKKNAKGVRELAEQWPKLETGSLYTLVLSLSYLDDEEASSTRPGPRLSEALEKARKLVPAISAKLEEKGLDAKLVAALTSTESPSIVVLASLMVRYDPALRAGAIRSAVSGRKRPPLQRKQLREDLAMLTPAELIDGYVRNQPGITRRTHYNLACYYVTLAGYAKPNKAERCYALAIDSLEDALLGGELIDWAREDPSLEALRGHPHFGKLFIAVLAKHTIAAHA